MRVTWTDHVLYGAELPVDGWHHVDGRIHLVVSLPDGSRSYFPGRADGPLGLDSWASFLPLLLTGDAVRQRASRLTSAIDINLEVSPFAVAKHNSDPSASAAAP
ncbi:MAG: hypothetical protein IPF51_08045 [Dehalococcoidia bacterium]|uniref:hypothetical protein n=1 Tax=Candidatus Amarobacter glycogenicus TaxID=3140699 RepID=UPI003136F7DE|nr:hypothetical protein [Dehalococcoidia bacterium]